jgi:aromatic-L-amino-acid/L-tryptophan decarboxylase
MQRDPAPRLDHGAPAPHSARMTGKYPDGLELPPERMRELGYGMVDLLVDRYVGLRDERAWSGATRARLEALLKEPAPETAGSFEAAVERLMRDVVPWGGRVDHPAFMAFVPGAPTWPGVLGDFMAAGMNIFQGTWLASAGVSELELVVIDWFREWLGFDDSASGLLVSGGSAANLTAIAGARLLRFGAHAPDAVVYCSAETHSSVVRAARVLGFADDRIRHIRVDRDQRIDIATLRDALSADRADGLVPFLVVATAGTTSTGAVDPLPAIADLCREHGAWLHVDAAYGGFAVLTERGRAALAGIERADSVTLDPHKWLYQPFEAGCLLVRDGTALDRAFHILPPYLQDTALPGRDGDSVAADGPLPVNFADRGIQLTRSARVLKLWLSIQTFGVGAFRRAIDRCIDLAARAECRIRESDAFELLTPAQLGIVCFRLRAPADTVDRLNRDALRHTLESGVGMISSTLVGGHFALRLCVLNYRTEESDVDRVLDRLEAASIR